MPSSPKILILGAGPTGLGAAWRLQQLGYTNWTICERNPYVGGLSASFLDPAGFTWDIGGHVVFSHYPAFDQFFQEMTQGRYFSHVRKSYVRIAQTFVPVYFQNNIRYLPPDLRDECLRGLEEVERSGGAPDTFNFLAWCRTRFGEGITRIFMQPDNEKRWVHPLTDLSTAWVGERVSPVDVERIRQNIALGRDDVSWGPNSRFDFPEHGGTGSIFAAMGDRIGGDRLRLNKEVVGVDPVKKQVLFSDWSVETYDALLSTLPIDQLVKMTAGAPEPLIDRASALRHADGLIVGLGFRQPVPSDKCWIYCPEQEAPFYRVTYFSNYSRYNAPDENHYSLMCDISYSPHRPASKDTIVDETVRGLIATGMIAERDQGAIESTYLIDAPYSYPIPTLDRDAILTDLHAWLEPRALHSRGRFGAFLYEIGNMDHSVVQGIQWVDRILQGARESVWLDRK